MSKQIPRIKYRQGVKLVASMPDTQVPMLNQELRRLGFDDEEVEAFWQSSTELRVRHQIFTEEQKFLARLSLSTRFEEPPAEETEQYRDVYGC